MKERGFTLLELVVASAVFMTVLLLASDQLRRALGDTITLGSELLRPSQEKILLTLRRDVRGAAGVQSPVASWNSGPLVLADGEGGEIVWLLAEGRLVRHVRPAGGERSGGVVAAQPQSWRWRNTLGGAVEIELGLAWHRRRRPLTLGRDPTLHADAVERLTLSPRDRPRESY